jgi:hypothetical protein
MRIEEVDPALVEHLAVSRDQVVERRTVLGDCERDGRILAVQPEQHLQQAFRIDLPAARSHGSWSGPRLDVVASGVG